MIVDMYLQKNKVENLKIALLYGADAVYFGGRNYSLRANAKNFSRDEIKEAVEEKTSEKEENSVEETPVQETEVFGRHQNIEMFA